MTAEPATTVAPNPVDTYPGCPFCGGVMVCEQPNIVVCVQCRTDAICDGARPEVAS